LTAVIIVLAQNEPAAEAFVDITPTIPLESGTDGEGNAGAACATDPLITFTSDSVSSAQPALIG
jgi:hypothetical protein